MRRRVSRCISAALAGTMLAGAMSCDRGSGPTVPGTGASAMRVLFLGNSLTYTNDLPGMVAALANAAGVNVVAQSSSYANYALIDHWNDEERALVRNGRFDIVILQQGPTSLPVNRDSLRLWTAMWAPEIRAAGGRPALFAVWPEAERANVFPDVSESYHLAAEDVSGLFFPVGDTWLEVWSTNPNAPLYGPDGFHPSVAGTYAAAVVITAMITHQDAAALADLPASFSLYGNLDPSLAYVIRQAANSVIQRLGPQPLSVRQ